MSETFLIFVIGFVAGVISQRLYCHAKARWEDKRHPNKDGSRHKVIGLNKTWVAYAVVAIIIGAVVVSVQATYELAQETAQETTKLAHDTAECQRQFNEALIYSRGLNREADDITARFQDVSFERTATLNRLLKEFGSSLNPEYVKAKQVVDEEYYNQVNDLFIERKENDKRRADNPYPEPSCGK